MRKDQIKVQKVVSSENSLSQELQKIVSSKQNNDGIFKGSTNSAKSQEFGNSKDSPLKGFINIQDIFNNYSNNEDDDALRRAPTIHDIAIVHSAG